MVYTECSGGQDQKTTTDGSYPHIPPPRTKNCYFTSGEHKFDRSECGTANDGACIGRGEGDACTDDDYGGYCKHDNNYWVSIGEEFKKLSDSDLLNRYKSDSSDTDIRVRRALKDQERVTKNTIRELQIMGRDPVRSKRIGPGDKDDNEVHNFITDMLFKVGLSAAAIIFIISASFIIIRMKSFKRLFN